MLHRSVLLSLILLSFSTASSSIAGDRVLLVGDSHFTGGATSPGIRLDEKLRKDFSDLTTYGVCGASSASWLMGPGTKCGYFKRTADAVLRIDYPHPARAPSLAEVFQDRVYDVVIIALGSNMAVPDYSMESLRIESQKISNLIKVQHARCYWITPMNARSIQKRNRVETEQSLKNVVDTLRSSLEGLCEIIDGSSQIRYPDQGGDGLHTNSLPRAEAEVLAERWSDAVLSLLRRAILTDTI